MDLLGTCMDLPEICVHVLRVCMVLLGFMDLPGHLLGFCLNSICYVLDVCKLDDLLEFCMDLLHYMLGIFGYKPLVHMDLPGYMPGTSVGLLGWICMDLLSYWICITFALEILQELACIQVLRSNGFWDLKPIFLLYHRPLHLACSICLLHHILNGITGICFHVAKLSCMFVLAGRWHMGQFAAKPDLRVQATCCRDDVVLET